MMKFNQWERNAEIAMRVYGAGVDFEDRFYVCPDCGDYIYECDWSDEELSAEFCPICGFVDDLQMRRIKHVSTYNKSI